MLQYDKIFKDIEIQRIFSDDNVDHLESVEIGRLLNFDQSYVIKIMNFWCNRVDKLIELDKEVNGTITWRSENLIKYRGFTYSEFHALFNQKIDSSEFIKYPIFQQLAQKKGGINYEKQRAYFISNYEYHEEDYVRILKDNGFESILSFFFGKLNKLSLYFPLDKLKRHTYICGATGTGKSVLLRTIFYRLQKKYTKYSMVLIDPHGDLAEEVKRFHLNKNYERVVYIDPFLKDTYTPTFNPFELKDTSIKNLNHAAEQIITSLEEVLNREGGRLSEVMMNMMEKAVYFLLQREDSSFNDLLDLLNAKEDIVEEANEFDDFFNDYYCKPNNKTREALYNRIGRLMNSPVFKNLLGGQSTFDLEYLLNSGKVIIFNLGDLGELTQIALGKFIVASIKSIVRKRDTGKFVLPTFLVVDECQQFISGSFEIMLSQLRKYGLHLILANQYVNQLGDQAESVKKNTAIKIIGGDDMDDMKKMITVAKDDPPLKDYQFYAKVRSRSLLKFKSPNFLLKGGKRYQLKKEEEIQLDKHMIENYYKIIGSDPKKRKSFKKDSKIKADLNAPSPNFGLRIKK